MPEAQRSQQSVIATRSRANEYMALKHAIVEAVWIRDLLTEMELGDLIKGPTIMLGDNDQATSLTSIKNMGRISHQNRTKCQNYRYVWFCVSPHPAPICHASLHSQTTADLGLGEFGPFALATQVRGTADKYPCKCTFTLTLTLSHGGRMDGPHHTVLHERVHLWLRYGQKRDTVLITLLRVR